MVEIVDKQTLSPGINQITLAAELIAWKARAGQFVIVRVDETGERIPLTIADTDPDAPGQLYNLANDPGETINVYSKHPEIVAELKALLEEARTNGRTAPKR